MQSAGPHTLFLLHKDWGHGPQICILRNFPGNADTAGTGEPLWAGNIYLGRAVRRSPQPAGTSRRKDASAWKEGVLERRLPWKGLRLLSGRRLGRNPEASFFPPPKRSNPARVDEIEIAPFPRNSRSGGQMEDIWMHMLSLKYQRDIQEEIWTGNEVQIGAQRGILETRKADCHICTAGAPTKRAPSHPETQRGPKERRDL